MQQELVKTILEYLARYYDSSVHFKSLSPWKRKKKGMRDILLLKYSVSEQEKGLFIKSFPNSAVFSQENAWTLLFRAYLFSQNDGFRTPSLGILVSKKDDSIVVSNLQAVYLLEEKVEGELYAESLLDMIENGWSKQVEETTRKLAHFLAEIHKIEYQDKSLIPYVRMLYGGEFGLLTHLDLNPRKDREWEEEIIRLAFQWRYKLLESLPSPRAIHGDFHAWNIIFASDGTIRVTGVLHTNYGLPADDIAALTINFFSFAVQYPTQKELWKRLYYVFLDTYLENFHSKEQILSTLPFFLGWRAVVLSNPEHNPDGMPQVSEFFQEFALRMFALNGVCHFRKIFVSQKLYSPRQR
jgi:hypothetical protein